MDKNQTGMHVDGGEDVSDRTEHRHYLRAPLCTCTRSARSRNPLRPRPYPYSRSAAQPSSSSTRRRPRTSSRPEVRSREKEREREREREGERERGREVESGSRRRPRYSSGSRARKGALHGERPATAGVLSTVAQERRGSVGEGRVRAVSAEDRGGDIVNGDFACGAPRVRSEKYAGREARLRFLEVTVASGMSQVGKGAEGSSGAPYERRR
jgi:hypothetical protein